MPTRTSTGFRPVPEVMRFVVCLFVTAVFLIGVWSLLQESSFGPLGRADATVLAFMLRLLGLGGRAHGTIVTAVGFQVAIAKKCPAVDMALLYTAFVVAYPSCNTGRLKGILMGLPFPYAANLLRIVSLYFAGRASNVLFDYSHVYLGQSFAVLAVLTAVGWWMHVTAPVRIVPRRYEFLLTVFAASVVGFIVWIPLQRPYVLAMEWLLNGAFSAAGIERIFPRHAVYEYTFNLVPFAALVVASQTVDIRGKLRCLLFGLAILTVSHAVFKTVLVLIGYATVRYADAMLIGAYRVSAIVLPIALWLWVKYPYRRMHRCPLCGEERTGLEDHIKAKHGRDALRNEQVREALARVDILHESRFTSSNRYLASLMRPSEERTCIQNVYLRQNAMHTKSHPVLLRSGNCNTTIGRCLAQAHLYHCASDIPPDRPLGDYVKRLS